MVLLYLKGHHQTVHPVLFYFIQTPSTFTFLTWPGRLHAWMVQPNQSHHCNQVHSDRLLLIFGGELCKLVIDMNDMFFVQVLIWDNKKQKKEEVSSKTIVQDLVLHVGQHLELVYILKMVSFWGQIFYPTQNVKK